MYKTCSNYDNGMGVERELEEMSWKITSETKRSHQYYRFRGRRKESQSI